MKNLKLFAILILVSSIAMISCSKGTAGPAGPAGPTGSGAIQHTSWIAIATSYQGQDNNNDSVFQDVIAAASITQKILDSGLILAYIQYPDGSVSEVSDLSIFLDVNYSVGNITLTSFGVDLTNYGFRYIVVAGTTEISSALKGYTKEQLKTMSYSTIVKLLGITDKPVSN